MAHSYYNYEVVQWKLNNGASVLCYICLKMHSDIYIYIACMYIWEYASNDEEWRVPMWVKEWFYDFKRQYCHSISQSDRVQSTGHV